MSAFFGICLGLMSSSTLNGSKRHTCRGGHKTGIVDGFAGLNCVPWMGWELHSVTYILISLCIMQMLCRNAMRICKWQPLSEFVIICQLYPWLLFGSATMIRMRSRWRQLVVGGRQAPEEEAIANNCFRTTEVAFPWERTGHKNVE